MEKYTAADRLSQRMLRQLEFGTLIEQLTSKDGEHSTALNPLRLFRSSAPQEPKCGVCEPVLWLIAQGRRQVMLAGEAYVYEASHYLLVSVDLPVVGQIIEATPEKPYLCLRLSLDVQQISMLVTEVNPPHVAALPASKRGLFVGCVDAGLLDAATRLLRLLETPEHLGALAPLVMREILYRLLAGPGGADLRRMAMMEGERQGIASALRWLKVHFAEPIRMETLAREASMSLSAFHYHFKAVTTVTPLQYQKHLRLQEARRLMLGEPVDVGTVGLRVGYESQSHFNREYRRLFGNSPLRDVAQLRENA